MLQERGPPNLGFGNMTGGFMTGGQAGTLKMTIPTAFTISMLAWSMLEFPQVTPLPRALQCPAAEACRHTQHPCLETAFIGQVHV